MTHEELEQRLWELEYGLLSDQEAAALRARIADDSAVGQLHDHVRGQISLVGQAARIAAPRIPLRVPDVEETHSPFAEQTVSVRPAAKSARIRRSANWSLGIASSLLIGLLSWTAWSSTAPQHTQVAVRGLSSEQQKSLVIAVDAPQSLSREAKTPIGISTHAADGTPQSVKLTVQLADRFFEDVVTNEQGRAVVELPRTDTASSRLNFAFAFGVQPGLQVELPTAETEYMTHLSTDKPRYRPGEVVRYRSVTLSRFGLKADRDMAVEFQVSDPAGQAVIGSTETGTTEHGVGNGELSLSAEAAPGQYTLFARSPTQAFPPVQSDFSVQSPAPRQYDIDVKWGDSYAAGGGALGDVAVRTLAGQPASNVKLNIRAFVEGRQVDVAADELSTDSAGKAAVQIELPAQLGASEGELGIKAGEQEVIWKPIPLRADQVQVDFYPEGGDLTLGVENRVYFHAHDFEGRPVTVRGRVVDGGGREIVAVATGQEGRSAFRFTPESGAAYSLAIDVPPAIQSRPPLPPVMEQSHLVLDAEAGVFEAGAPVRLKLRSRAAPAEFLVVAYCRGVMVGQRAGAAAEFHDGLCNIELPVIAEAAGVLRVTVFDASKQPTEPLAERLVYRRPLRKLQMEWAGLLPKYSTGATVQGEVITTDETGEPVSSVLGISAVDRSVLQLAGRPIPRMATQYLLLGDVRSPEKLEDANFLLSSEPTAASALDLLLGTQGWRRFERIPADRMAGREQLSRDGFASRARGFDAGAAGNALGEGAGGGGAPGGAAPIIGELGRLAEALDDAPRRSDNRSLVEALQEKKVEDAGIQPARLPVQKPISRDWIVVVSFGLFVIAGTSVVIRRYPTGKTVLAGVAAVAGLVVLSLVVVFGIGRGGAEREMASKFSGGDQSPDARSAVTESEFAPMKSDRDAPAEKETLELRQQRYEPPRAEKQAPAAAEPATAPTASASAGATFAPAPVATPKSASPVPAAPAPATTSPAPPAPASPAPAPAAQAPAARAPAAPAPAARAPAARAPAARAPVPMPMPAPVAAPGPVPPPAPKVVPSAEQALAPKAPRNSRFLLPPVSDPTDKSNKEEVRKSTDRQEFWRRAGGQLMEEKPQRKALEETTRAKDLAAESPLESASPGLRNKNKTEGAGVGGALGATRGLKQQETDLRSGRKSDEPTKSDLERFVVRHYAHLGGLAKKNSDSKVREVGDYAESVYWNPLIVTDEQGRASFEFSLPDTVTEFRILAEGHQDGRLGDAEQTIVVEGKK